MRVHRTTLACPAADHRRAVLAAIARREWLLQMLAPGAAWCRRSNDPAYARGNTLVIAIGDVSYFMRREFGRNNRIGYQNPEVVRLTDQATADPDGLDRIYRALTEILRADLPVTRLVPWTNTTFARRRVRGIAPYMVTALAEDLGLEEQR